MKYKLSELFHENIAIGVETRKEANELCRYLHKMKRRWQGGESYATNNHWNVYYSKTYYHLKSNTFFQKYYMSDKTCVKYKDVRHLFYGSRFHMKEFDI